METKTHFPNFSQAVTDATVQEKFGMAIGDIGRLWRDRLNSRLRPLGLTHSKWRALLYLSRVPDGITQIELARLLSVEAPTAARLVKQLEEAGWLTRHSSPEDARRKVVCVTAKAKKVVAYIDVEVRKLRAETVGRLSAEQAEAGLIALQAVQRYLS
jgi:MarR family transcriptional regulator for hemolysin